MITIPDVRLCRHVALCRLSQEDTQEKISVGIQQLGGFLNAQELYRPIIL